MEEGEQEQLEGKEEDFKMSEHFSLMQTSEFFSLPLGRIKEKGCVWQEF